ncbi:MAG TPA: hypothetical protein H9980_01870, partial [Candidatus Erysipelatoclostridium merdavium]|nr:hypothetical protein [Candidatus Erysipelatoclostridium merdavium]
GRYGKDFAGQRAVFRQRLWPRLPMIYSEDENQIKVSELIYENDTTLNKMIAAIINDDKELIIESDMLTNINGESQVICTMLTNFLKNSCQDNNFYINECL